MIYQVIYVFLLDISNKMNLKNPTSTVFYSIEETIKAYRKLSQKNIKTLIPDITVDQALILQFIDEEQLTQTEIADKIFKDYASMTRIVALLIEKKYVTKEIDDNDRRVAVLKITKNGKKTLNQLIPIIEENRKTALNGLTSDEVNRLKQILKKITKNCKK